MTRTLALLAMISIPATASAGKRTKLSKLDVASLTVEAPSGMCAGAETQLVVAATLADGSVLRTPEDLRPRDFDVQADLGDIRSRDALTIENTGLDLAGRQVTLTVSGKRSNATGTVSLPISFACAIGLDYTGDGQPGAVWVPPRSERDIAEIEAYRAETGKTGPRLKDIARAALPVGYAIDNLKAAKPALKGEDGSDGAEGGPGQAGQPGGTGGPGLPGAQGHDLVVEIGPAPSSEAAGLALVVVHPQDGGPRREVLVDPAGGRLTLVTRGGTGGRGGKGGTGGRGGPGIWDYNGGRGGDGGVGGGGGPGGPGGRGGNVEIRYDSAHPELLQLIQVDAAGGVGGLGGDGGSFGSGGPGAEGGGESGSMGPTDSPTGAPGPDGAPGTVTQTPVPAATLSAQR